jgi:choline kinase
MLEIGGRSILSRLIETLRSRVERIHVVVGYREELIIDLCARNHRDVVIVRNPDFRTTNTARSMALGAQAYSGKVLFMDGDLLISPASLTTFIEQSSREDWLMGVAPTTSENAVGVKRDIATATVSEFTNDEITTHEWANVFSGPARALDRAENYVFEELRLHLPMPAFELDLCEIDTVADLDRARAFGKKLDRMGMP